MIQWRWDTNTLAHVRWNTRKTEPSVNFHDHVSEHVDKTCGWHGQLAGHGLRTWLLIVYCRGHVETDVDKLSATDAMVLRVNSAAPIRTLIKRTITVKDAESVPSQTELMPRAINGTLEDVWLMIVLRLGH